jgi:hypothetical protein
VLPTGYVTDSSSLSRVRLFRIRCLLNPVPRFAQPGGQGSPHIAELRQALIR